ncbi:MAG: imidazole glycerol phosphate synthase subunit HisH [Flavobacteriaceae bacterium]|nr:imidazole glycerol phosphate synthase subunit HisH [Flavobacteriaceae bacterium]
MKIALIDYGAGNTQSVLFALKRLGYSATLSHDPVEIESADKVIFPGVGEAGSAMAKLQGTGLDRLIPKLQQPVLGICLGMQLMCAHSEEGDTHGLGIFDVNVKKFDNRLKVPQIGWNSITNLQGSLFKNVSEGAFMYLVHSFYAPLSDYTTAVSEYGIKYSVALQKDNFYGLQFHPEKSSLDGSKILQNFLEL